MSVLSPIAFPVRSLIRRVNNLRKAVAREVDGYEGRTAKQIYFCPS